ncbi:hypothetical protein [Paenibacillus solani]|uniref:ParM/StbA family protein n=1 Tax=Paenibacillus solani TaxID=1705565 RepID=UPI003D2C6A47
MGKKEIPTHVVSMDTGNGGNKIISDTVKRKYYEAVIGRYEAPPEQSRMNKKKSATAYQVESDPQQWLVGYDAIEEYKLTPIPIHARDSLQRYSQKMFSYYAKIGLAQAVENAPDMVPILLITSTPAYDYHNPDVRKQLNEVLFDLHKVHINDERKVINVVQYEPMSETEAILYDLYFDDNGNVADENIENEDILVINCGFGTTDLSRYDEMSYIKLKKETLKTSFRDVYQRCADWLSTTLKRQIDVQEVARQLESQKEEKIKIFEFVKEPVAGFNDTYRSAVEGVFADLIAEMNGIIDDPDLFNRIVCVGGPIEEWGPMFKEWNTRRVQIPEDPQFATARGMYKYGKFYVIPNLQSQVAATKD